MIGWTVMHVFEVHIHNLTVRRLHHLPIHIPFLVQAVIRR